MVATSGESSKKEISHDRRIFKNLRTGDESDIAVQVGLARGVDSRRNLRSGRAVCCGADADDCGGVI